MDGCGCQEFLKLHDARPGTHPGTNGAHAFGCNLLPTQFRPICATCLSAPPQHGAGAKSQIIPCALKWSAFSFACFDTLSAGIDFACSFMTEFSSDTISVSGPERLSQPNHRHHVRFIPICDQGVLCLSSGSQVGHARSESNCGKSIVRSVVFSADLVFYRMRRPVFLSKKSVRFTWNANSRVSPARISRLSRSSTETGSAPVLDE